MGTTSRAQWRAAGAGLAAAALGAAFPNWLVSQPIPRPDYVTYLPRGLMSAVSATDASVRFEIYGNRDASGYTDRAPRNGVDDRRDQLFMALATRFAPWMVRNAYGFPTDVRKMLATRHLPLVRDRFNLAGEEPVLVSSDTIDLSARGAPCSPANPGSADCRLLALFQAVAPPRQPSAKRVTPTFDPEEVLYIDYPGDSPKSWAREYGAGGGFKVSPRYIGYAKTYVHPFIVQVGSAPNGAPRYDFVLQYWFFYPTNDAGNTHEGDWEHLNVSIAPRSHVTEWLDSSTVTALLDDRLDRNELVIRRIDYFFHHWVSPVDYSRPNVYLPRAEWKRQRDSLPTTHEGERAIWDDIRYRAYLDEAETRVNLNPLAYVGGDGRGLNLLTKAPGALGLSTHGSFPFPGLYKAVGPAGTGESIDHRRDIHRTAPARDADETAPVVRYDRADRVEILPDWERLSTLALEEQAIRWDWAWFLLPAHSGYPATQSTLAGILRFVDTGNVPPGSPAYSGGWNRAGGAPGFAPYIPHRVSGIFPLDVQDQYNARWGYLNATAPTLSFLPPFDILVRVVERPILALLGRSAPTYVRGEDVPARRVGIGLGTARFTPNEDFQNLLGFPELSNPVIQRANNITGTPLIGYGLLPATFEPIWSGAASIDLFLGRRFVTTNSLSHGRSAMRRDILFSNFPTVTLRADLNYWEYAGKLRWNFMTGRVQPFVNAGYGLTWYRLEDLTGFGENLGDSRWVRHPGFFKNLLPNTWHAGTGIELLPVYGFGKANLGLKAAIDLRTHRLGLHTDAGNIFFQDSRLTTWVFRIGATAAY